MNKELKNKIAKFLVDNNVIFEFQKDNVAISRYSVLGHIFMTGHVGLCEKDAYNLFFEIMSKEVGETVGYSLYDDTYVYCSNVVDF